MTLSTRVSYLLIALMWLSVIGQVTAATMTCAHDSMDMSVQMTNSKMAHMSHGMTQGASQDMQDCCGDECTCPMTGCASIALVQYIPSKSSLINSYKISHFTPAIALPRASTLYRPPISA